MVTRHEAQSFRSGASTLMLGALVVVFGDIGTSPLYAMRESFAHIDLSHNNIFGVLSLVFWSIMIIVSFKYVLVVLRADNRGEGGVLSLMALASPTANSLKRRGGGILLLGIVGAALLYGDSILTPAISVLSAVEGIKIAAPVGREFIVVLTLMILGALFMVQSRGTALLGRLFGPLMIAWFGVLGLLGVIWIVKYPFILSAISPYWFLDFFYENTWHAFLTLGAVFLALTGAEALYADMGHFGLRPIKRVWFFFVCPALLLNYFGQGALLISTPGAIQNPFYLLAPEWALYPMVGLATLAAIIASQAVISGAFSLTSQAIKLGLLPRMKIVHTSSSLMGQIYVPVVNWLLFIGTIFLVLEFRTSSNLAAAYGLAVSCTMVITSSLMYFVMRKVWHWKRSSSISAVGLFLTFDILFLFANILKVPDGGWITIIIAVAISLAMVTWASVKRCMRKTLAEQLPPFDTFIHDIPEMTPLRVPGTAIYMSSVRDVTPPALMYNLKHNMVIHDVIVVVSVVIEEKPFVTPVHRVFVENFERNIYRVTVRYGFMEEVDLPRALELCGVDGLTIDVSKAIFFLGREWLTFKPRSSIPFWQQAIFRFLALTPLAASRFFAVPPTQLVEIGFHLEV